MSCRRGFCFLTGRPRLVWPRHPPIMVQRVDPDFISHFCMQKASSRFCSGQAMLAISGICKSWAARLSRIDFSVLTYASTDSKSACLVMSPVEAYVSTLKSILDNLVAQDLQMPDMANIAWLLQNLEPEFGAFVAQVTQSLRVNRLISSWLARSTLDDKHFHALAPRHGSAFLLLLLLPLASRILTNGKNAALKLGRPLPALEGRIKLIGTSLASLSNLIPQLLLTGCIKKLA